MTNQSVVFSDMGTNVSEGVALVSAKVNSFLAAAAKVGAYEVCIGQVVVTPGDKFVNWYSVQVDFYDPSGYV